MYAKWCNVHVLNSANKAAVYNYCLQQKKEIEKQLYPLIISIMPHKFQLIVYPIVGTDYTHMSNI